jgi:hypothetical protein
MRRISRIVETRQEDRHIGQMGCVGRADLYLAGWKGRAYGWRNRAAIGTVVAKTAPTEHAGEAQERVPERRVVSRAKSCSRDRIT